MERLCRQLKRFTYTYLALHDVFYRIEVNRDTGLLTYALHLAANCAGRMNQTPSSPVS